MNAEKNCPICSTSFVAPAKAHNKVYCSRQCKVKAAGIRERQQPRKRIRNYNGNFGKQVYKLQKERAIFRKLLLIKEKGGACSVCGYSKNMAALCFHHVDPSIKEMKLDSRSLANTSLQNLREEIDKCILLCNNCHMELHYPHLNMIDLIALSGTDPE
jgi:hypothetical protein